MPNAPEPSPPRGRPASVAGYGLLAAGTGHWLFRPQDDLSLTVLLFVVSVWPTMMLGVAVFERADSGTRWAKADTVIVAVLACYAVLLVAVAALFDLQEPFHNAAVCFAALFALLAVMFTARRLQR